MNAYEESKEAGTQEIVTAVANCGKAFHKLVDLTVCGSVDADRETSILKDALSRFLWIANQFAVLKKEPCKIEADRILLLLRSNSLDLVLEQPKPKLWTAYSYRLEEIVKELAQVFSDRGEVDAVLGMKQVATAIKLEGEQPTGGKKPPPSRDSDIKPTQSKKSTVNGDAQTVLASAFILHHKFQNGIIGNSAPIGTSELSRQANVAKSTAKAFIDKWFGRNVDGKNVSGRTMYESDAIRDKTKLLIALTQLSGEPVIGLIPSYGSDPTELQAAEIAKTSGRRTKPVRD